MSFHQSTPNSSLNHSTSFSLLDLNQFIAYHKRKEMTEIVFPCRISLLNCDAPTSLFIFIPKPSFSVPCHESPFIPFQRVPYTLFMPIFHYQKQSHESPSTLSFEYSIPLTLTPHSISSLQFNSLAIHIDFSPTPSPTT